MFLQVSTCVVSTKKYQSIIRRHLSKLINNVDTDKFDYYLSIFFSYEVLDVDIHIESCYYYYFH